jgi:hypothetical protein
MVGVGHPRAEHDITVPVYPSGTIRLERVFEKVTGGVGETVVIFGASAEGKGGG